MECKNTLSSIGSNRKKVQVPPPEKYETLSEKKYLRNIGIDVLLKL
jgi:hypothetical protein